MSDLTFAATIGSYAMPGFVELNIVLLREVFGDIPILVSDDLSPWSADVAKICNKHNVPVYCSETTRGHFAGDWQSVINAVEFARTNECEVGIKISQRFCLLDPRIIPAIEQKFSNPETLLVVPASPGKDRIKAGSKFFSKLPILTDIMFMRRTLDPHFLMTAYQERVRNNKDISASLVEGTVHELMLTKLAGKSEMINELTEHISGHPHYYLRRYQDPVQLYASIAERRGVRLAPVLSEWARIQPRYSPRPVVV